MTKVKKLDAACGALTEVLTKAFAGMPCTNRETAAEKAAAHKWLKKFNADLRARNRKKLEQLRRQP